MNILEKIIESTKIRVKSLNEKYNLKYFEESSMFRSPVVSLKHYVNRGDKNGIIAEFKRCSPSKGMLNAYAKVDETTLGYMRAACSALSILTEPEFFKGSNADLTLARKFNFCPILRKDFIIDPIQIYESRAIGADAILLIAKILSDEQINELKQCAMELGLEVLIEADEIGSIQKIDKTHPLIGINSRNLSTMEIDLKKMVELRKEFSENTTIIAESGIETVEQVNYLRTQGFSGFLIGSAFMKFSEPGKACYEFTKKLNSDFVAENSKTLV